MKYFAQIGQFAAKSFSYGLFSQAYTQNRFLAGILIPFTAFGRSIGLTALPLGYFPWLIGILLSYCILTQLVKNWYIRKFVRWL